MILSPKLKRFARKPVFWVGTGIVVIVCAVAVVSSSGGAGKYDYVEAAVGTVRQEVGVTGEVRPVEGVDLAFEKSGRVRRISVAIGDDVYRGEPLVFLEAGDLYAELEEAEAGLEAEELTLAELERGPTSYEVNVARSELEEASQALANQYGSIAATVEDAYAQAESAVRTKTSDMFSSSHILEYNACDSSAESRANYYRSRMADMLVEWRGEIDSLGSGNDALLAALETAKANMREVNRFLNAVSDTLTKGCELSDSTVAAYRTNISTARDNVNASIADIDTVLQNIALKKKTVLLKENKLDKLIAGASEEEIATQKAVVRKASAKVDNMRAQIEKTILRAPFAGVVTKIDAELGEIVEAYTPVVSVVSNSGFKIEIKIPEVDISEVSVGDRADVTLDAYGDDVHFEAEVAAIDSTETIVEGVATYGAMLEFAKQDGRIRSGMTANVNIITGVSEDAVFIPQRAVVERNGGKYVRVLEDGKAVEREVQLGLEGSQGNVEVIKGVKKGDKVIVFIRGE
mgnify:CR=1 FL=1